MFWLRLSLVFGIPVKTLQSMLSVEDLKEYMAYDRISPFGDTRRDMHAALISWAVSNALGSPGDIEKFMLPNFLEGGERTFKPKKRQSISDMTSILKKHYGNNR